MSKKAEDVFDVCFREGRRIGMEVGFLVGATFVALVWFVSSLLWGCP